VLIAGVAPDVIRALARKMASMADHDFLELVDPSRAIMVSSRTENAGHARRHAWPDRPARRWLRLRLWRGQQHRQGGFAASLADLADRQQPDRPDRAGGPRQRMLLRPARRSTSTVRKLTYPDIKLV